MNYDAAVRYLLSLGRELAAPTQACGGEIRSGKHYVCWPSGWGVRIALIPRRTSRGPTAKVRRRRFSNRSFADAGFRTGLNTSPHLERINERIRVNGEEIGDDAFAENLTRILAITEELLAAGKLRAHPTYFECVTAMAFEYFAQERVEFGIFEVGLGGRLGRDEHLDAGGLAHHPHRFRSRKFPGAFV